MPAKPSLISCSPFSSSVVGFFPNGGFCGFRLSFEVELSVNLPRDVSFLATTGLLESLGAVLGFAVLGLDGLLVPAGFVFAVLLFGGDFGALLVFLVSVGFGCAAAALAEKTGLGNDSFTGGSCFFGATFLMAEVDFLG